MSSFGDFGPLSERRKAEIEKARKKKLIVIGGTISVVAIVLLLGVGTVAYITKPNASSEKSSHSNTANAHQLQSSSRTIQLVCSPTTYPKTCEEKLAKYANATSTPKDLVKGAISAVVDEIATAAGHASLINSDDPQVKGAIEDCKELFNFAEDELANTLSMIDAHKLDQLPKVGHELKNWLSAVISYQQTCIDGFPEGELKTKMEEGMKVSKQLTSNSLAIVGKVSSFLNFMHVPAHGRSLLAKEEQDNVDDHGYPTWLTHEDRRVLASKVTKNMKPNVTVAKDGSGDYKTINDALANMPKTYTGRYLIYVKTGVYDETVLVTKNMVNVTIYGDGSQKSIITGNKNFVDGTRTFQTATFAAIGEGFMALAMGFRNTAGAIKHQAVAVRVQSDRAIFLNCRIEAYQDTLYTQTHRQFYRSCVISGTIDFIFGDAAVVLQNCILTLRRPLDNQQNIITAQGRTDPHETTGIVLHKCKIVADTDLVPEQDKFKSYLGRPWKEYSRTVIMETNIPAFIQKDGYMPWDGDFGLKTLYYAEYNNDGPGADTTNRVKWPGVKVISDRNKALEFCVAGFLHGQDWVKDAGAPVRLTLYN